MTAPQQSSPDATASPQPRQLGAYLAVLNHAASALDRMRHNHQPAQENHR